MAAVSHRLEDDVIDMKTLVSVLLDQVHVHVQHSRAEAASFTPRAQTPFLFTFEEKMCNSDMIK